MNVVVGRRGRDNDQGLIEPDRFPWSDQDVLDDAVGRGRHRVLHFHGLDGNQRLAGGHGLAGVHVDGEHRSWHRAGDGSTAA